MADFTTKPPPSPSSLPCQLSSATVALFPPHQHLCPCHRCPFPAAAASASSVERNSLSSNKIPEVFPPNFEGKNIHHLPINKPLTLHAPFPLRRFSSPLALPSLLPSPFSLLPLLLTRLLTRPALPPVSRPSARPISCRTLPLQIILLNPCRRFMNGFAWAYTVPTHALRCMSGNEKPGKTLLTLHSNARTGTLRQKLAQTPVSFRHFAVVDNRLKNNEIPEVKLSA